MLIGITGKAGAGKNTVADILSDNFGYSQLSFAGPLKAALAVLGMPEPLRAMKELNYPGKNYSYRKAAHTLGTEWARCLDEDFWVNLASEKVQELWRINQKNIVFSDVRFDNEAKMIHSNGGIVLLVVGRDYNTDNSLHASEAGVSSNLVDRVIYNTGSLEELEETVLTMFTSWRE